MTLRILFAGLICALVALAAESGMDLYQKALTQERAAGNLEEAIELYQRVAKEFPSDRALAAKALVQAARCYEKLGQDQAIKLYEKVARDFADQREFAEAARLKLAALRQPAPPAMTVRRIESQGLEIESPASTDGQRVIYFDENAGGLILGDLAGRQRRLIFKGKRGTQFRWIPSRDFSMVLLQSPPEANGFARFAVIKADGSGYHEIARLRAFVGSCGPSWSWDSRFVIACDVEPDGTRRFLSISVDNGQTREIFRAQTTVNTHVAYSPDGRLIAYGDGRRGHGNVFILPAEGGVPRLAFTNGSFLDWTRDGRHLLVFSGRSGAEALYLLPIQHGQPAGDPLLVRYGSFVDGHTTANGALVYSAIPPGGTWKTSIATFASNGHVAEWRLLNLKVGGQNGPSATWSPDGTQIAYTATHDDFGQPGSVVLVRNMFTGEEREVYRDEYQVFCSWAPRSDLICQRDPENAKSPTEMFSLDVDSGRAETLATYSGFGAGVHPNKGGRTFYLVFASPGLAWFNWDLAAKQLVRVEDQGLLPPLLVPSAQWFPRVMSGRELEIRPATGGAWRRVVSLNATPADNFPIAYTPDGKWILYGDTDSAGKEGLFRVSPMGGEPERIGDFPARYLRSCLLALSPDGHRLLATGSRAAPLEFWMLENFVSKSKAAR